MREVLLVPFSCQLWPLDLGADSSLEVSVEVFCRHVGTQQYSLGKANASRSKGAVR